VEVAYVLKSSNDKEYLLVVRTENEKDIKDMIEALSASRVQKVQDLAIDLEKSLYDDGNRRDTSKAGSKNKSKTATGNNSQRRKAKDS